MVGVAHSFIHSATFLTQSVPSDFTPTLTTIVVAFTFISLFTRSKWRFFFLFTLVFVLWWCVLKKMKVLLLSASVLFAICCLQSSLPLFTVPVHLLTQSKITHIHNENIILRHRHPRHNIALLCIPHTHHSPNNNAPSSCHRHITILHQGTHQRRLPLQTNARDAIPTHLRE